MAESAVVSSPDPVRGEVRRRTWGHRGGVWDWEDTSMYGSRPIPTQPCVEGGQLVYMCTYTTWAAGGTVASSVTEMMLIGNAAADAI